jgi:phage gp36-like protein
VFFCCVLALFYRVTYTRYFVSKCAANEFRCFFSFLGRVVNGKLSVVLTVCVSVVCCLRHLREDLLSELPARRS